MIFDTKIIAQSICNQTTELDIIDKLDAKAERMLLDKKIWKQIMVDDPTKNLKKLSANLLSEKQYAFRLMKHFYETYTLN